MNPLWRTGAMGTMATLMPMMLGSCLVERMVTDGQGNVIYQEPEIHTPFESERKKEAEVAERERELGW